METSGESASAKKRGCRRKTSEKRDCTGFIKQFRSLALWWWSHSTGNSIILAGLRSSRLADLRAKERLLALSLGKWTMGSSVQSYQNKVSVTISICSSSFFFLRSHLISSPFLNLNPDPSSSPSSNRFAYNSSDFKSTINSAHRSALTSLLAKA